MKKGLLVSALMVIVLIIGMIIFSNYQDGKKSERAATNMSQGFKEFDRDVMNAKSIVDVSKL